MVLMGSVAFLEQLATERAVFCQAAMNLPSGSYPGPLGPKDLWSLARNLRKSRWYAPRRDVLGFRSAEVAEMLSVSEASANSALQRG
jgi:hypothetical protein